jgi:hypothetical protein
MRMKSKEMVRILVVSTRMFVLSWIRHCWVEPDNLQFKKGSPKEQRLFEL